MRKRPEDNFSQMNHKKCDFVYTSKPEPYNPFITIKSVDNVHICELTPSCDQQPYYILWEMANVGVEIQRAAQWIQQSFITYSYRFR